MRQCPRARLSRVELLLRQRRRRKSGERAGEALRAHRVRVEGGASLRRGRRELGVVWVDAGEGMLAAVVDLGEGIHLTEEFSVAHQRRTLHR